MRKSNIPFKYGLCLAMILVVLMIMSKHGAIMGEAAVVCSPLELNPCKAATPETTRRSSVCCHKVREQRPCLCGYLKDPNLNPNLNSPSAVRIASTCGVPYPTCY